MQSKMFTVFLGYLLKIKDSVLLNMCLDQKQLWVRKSQGAV